MSSRDLARQSPDRWVRSRNLASLIVAPFLGLGAILLPVLGRPNSEGASFFHTVDHALNGYEGGAAVLLLMVGALLGVASTVPSWLLGLAGIASLPMISVAEIIQDPTSNNLSPIAWLFYFFEWAPVFAGAELTRRYRSRRSAASTPPEHRGEG